MKKIKLLTAGLLAFSVAGMASATTVIRVTGSTAFRKTTYNAIATALTNPVAAVVGTGGASDMTGDAQAVFSGTMVIGGVTQTIVFETAFGGSTGGLQVVTQGLTTIPLAFTDPTKVWLSPSTNTLTAVTVSGGAITGANVLGSPNYDSVGTADFTMADTFQSGTQWTTPAVASETKIGAVAYFWVKGLREQEVSPGDGSGVTTAQYGRFTNMTSQQARLLLSAGQLPLYFFTGDITDDSNVIVCLEGRNNDSGTRSTVQAETSGGTKDIQVQDMFENSTPGSTMTGASALTEVFDNGWNSGGKLAADLKTAIAPNATDPNFVEPFILVGYLGKPDKDTAVAGGAVALTYNGVDGTVAANIDNGAYSYWNYEHIDPTAAAAADSIKGPAINAVAAQEVALAALNGVTLSSLNVSRSADGAPVSP